MAEIGEGAYNPKQYTGEFSVQGTDKIKEAGIFSSQHQNKPQPPTMIDPERHYTGNYCGDPGCSICANWKKPVTSRHYTGIITDDLVDDPRVETNCGAPNCKVCEANRRWLEKQKSKKEVKMSENDKSYEYQKLYEVVTTYGEDRDNVIVKRTDVVAENEERARMQVKDDIEPDWDLDYVEQNVEEVAEIRVKRKPRETKEVVK